jgi:hypothetical protein
VIKVFVSWENLRVFESPFLAFMVLLGVRKDISVGAERLMLNASIF